MLQSEYKKFFMLSENLKKNKKIRKRKMSKKEDKFFLTINVK